MIDEDQYDRPWLAVFHRHVYVVAKGFDGIPYCYVSADGGKSFGPVPIPIYGTGVVPAEAGGRQPTPVEAFVTGPYRVLCDVVLRPLIQSGMRTVVDGGVETTVGLDINHPCQVSRHERSEPLATSAGTV